MAFLGTRFIGALAAGVLGLLYSVFAAADEIPGELQAMLEKAEVFELLSVSPARLQEKTGDEFYFHGWKVLGRTRVKDPEERRKLVEAFRSGVEENQGIGAACFKPRHGIRVANRGKTADFVICFECYRVQVFVDDRGQNGLLVTRSPEPVFNGALREARLPLSEN